MNNNEQQQPKLTDEEVWLRAYCAAMQSIKDKYYWYREANFALKDFKERFKKND